jgi:hypothetical protein
MKTPVRALQPGNVVHTGAGRAAVLYVAPTAPEAPLVHLVLGRIDGQLRPEERVHVAHWPAAALVQVERDPAVDWLLEVTRQLSDLVAAQAPPPPEPVGDVRATCTLINNPPTIGARPHGNR